MSRNRKRTKTFYEKTIAIFLSLDVQVRDDDKAVLFTLPLIQLIPAMVLLEKLVLWLILGAWAVWDLGSVLMRFKQKPAWAIYDCGSMTLALWILDLRRWINNFRVMLAIAGIGFKSALFGIGVLI